MKKNSRSLAVVIILFLALAIFASRHFSSSRFKVAVPVAPVKVIDIKKPPVTELPEEEAVRISEEKARPLTVAESADKKEIAGPDWFKNMFSLYEKYYPSWQSGNTVTLASSAGTQPAVPPFSPTAVSSAASAPRASVRRRVVQPSSLRRTITPGTTTASAGTTASSSSGSGGQGGAIPSDPGNQDDNGQPFQPEPVTIERTISSSGDYVTLNMAVHMDISGLIIIETLPPGYTIISATPPYSKKSGNSYRWLIYGTSVTSQTIEYRVTGSGGGSIAGVYNSTKGTGTIQGSSTF